MGALALSPFIQMQQNKQELQRMGLPPEALQQVTDWTGRINPVKVEAYRRNMRPMTYYR